MSIINFPQNPTLYELYPFGGKTWQWNGSYWGIYSGTSLSIVDINYSATTGELWYTKSDLSQNNTSKWSYFTGGSYNTSTREITLSANTGGTFTISNLDYNGVTNLDFNIANYDLTIQRPSGNDTVSLSILATDMTVTGGTYNSSNGVVTFINNSGGTFEVSGFTSGYTDIRTTGVTYTPSTGLLTFNTTTTQNAYSANTAYYVSGTTDYLPKFNSTGITNSIIFNSGTTVGINNPNPLYLLHLSASTSSDTVVMFDAGNRIINGNNLSNSRFVSSSDTTEKTSSFNLFDNNSAEYLSNTNNAVTIYLERSGTTFNPVTTNAKRNDLVVAQNFNAIEENFEIRKMFKEMFNAFDNSPVYQLKKHYPEIHDQFMCRETEDCNMLFRQNILKGIEQGLYRENINIDSFVKFYYTLIFSINENTKSEKEVFALEFDALEYHTRALATQKGILELEKHLHNPIL